MTRLTPAEIRDALTLANETAIGTIDQLTETFSPTDPRTDRARQLGRHLFDALAAMQDYMTLKDKPIDLDAPPVVMPVRWMDGTR